MLDGLMCTGLSCTTGLSLEAAGEVWEPGHSNQSWERILHVKSEDSLGFMGEHLAYYRPENEETWRNIRNVLKSSMQA